MAMLEQLKEKQRLGIQRFQHALDELAQWRRLYHAEDERLSDLENALMQFGSMKE